MVSSRDVCPTTPLGLALRREHLSGRGAQLQRSSAPVPITFSEDTELSQPQQRASGSLWAQDGCVIAEWPLFAFVYSKDSPEEAEDPSALPDSNRKAEEYRKNIWKGLLISIPYAASIGGTATLTGTAPNLILLGGIKR